MRRGEDRSWQLSVEDALVLAAICGMPWFWGGARLDVERVAGALIAVAACWALIRHGASGLGFVRGWAWTLPAFLLWAWALAQTAPLPRSWVATLSPKAAALQESAFGQEGLSGDAWLRWIENDALARVTEAPPDTPSSERPLTLDTGGPLPPKRFTLSLFPWGTLERAMWFGALLMAFLLVRRRTASERRAEAYRTVLFGLFVALAAIGILNRLTAPESLMWIRPMPTGIRAIGPYVNPSHFAGVMELGVPWMLGYGIFAHRHRRGSERGGTHGILAIAGAAICAVSALLAASKMGAATILASSTVLISIGVFRATRRWVLLGSTCAMALLLFLVATYGPLAERIEEFQAEHSGALSTNVRGVVWSAGLRMGHDFMLTGSGFGAFPEVFPTYMPRGESDIWLEMHNDYLELYLAGGVVAVALTLWLAVGYTIRAVRAVRLESKRGKLLPSLGLALGLLALAAHEVVDFNLQISANALLFVVLAAMAVPPSFAREART